MPEPGSCVHIVDDDPSVRTGLERLIRSAGLQAETFASAEDYIKYAKAVTPRCLILDVRMQGIDGLQLQDKLSNSPATCPIIFLTGHGDIPMSVRAMKHGAADFFTKPVDDGKLLAAVSKALEAHARSAQEKRPKVGGLFDQLTTREFEVMRCVVGGAPNKIIASHLAISEKTVKTHRGRVMRKLHVDSLAELIRLTIEAGIEPVDI